MDSPADPSLEPVRFAALDDALIVPEPALPAAPPSADAQLWNRARGLLGALGIVEGVAQVHPRLGFFRDACRDVACAFDASGRLSRSVDRAALARMLERAERELLEIDAEVSPGALKAQLELSAPPRPCIGGYAASLAASLGDDLARRDRLELLVTRLLTFQAEPGGRVLVETCDESRELLQRVVGGRQLPDDARRNVLGVLDDHRKRVDALSSAEGLFEKGEHLYANIYAFKLSLHERLLDFNVLYAIAGLNAAITNLLGAGASGVDPALKAQFQAARRAVCRTISSAGEEQLAPQPARFEPAPLVDPLTEVRVVWANRWRRSFAQRAAVKRPERQLAKGLVTALLLASLPFLSLPSRGSSGFRPLPESDLRQVAPWIESASLSAGGNALMGSVHPAAWTALDASDRRENAEALARELAGRNTLAAVLTSAGKMVVHIENAQVVFVQ